MKTVILFVLVFNFSTLIKSQSCFEAYDLLFQEAYKALPYNEFHKLELAFLDNLEGCNAPNFIATTVKGEELILSALKGKVIVLNFWFTTCPPCLKEIPELNKLSTQYSDDEVLFIGFARDNRDKLNIFFNKFGAFNYKIAPESYAIADDYKVIAWPQSMVIDKYGKVYKSWAGLTESPEQLRHSIEIAIEHCLIN